jgi:hypothetical protein
VRLSVTVSVSAIGVEVEAVIGAFVSLETLSLLVPVLVMVLFLIVGRWHRLAWHAVPSFRPSCQILVAAPLAAEGAPLLLHGTLTAQDAQPRAVHPANSNSRIAGCAIGDAVDGRFCKICRMDWRID